ncbi:MAPEG family protein [bacterium]|nr:MAPEG family protein [bacterium]
MTTELTLLILSVGLLMLTLLIQASAGILSNGLMAQAGSRDELPEKKVFHARVTRLRDNMIENLLMFAPVVLVAQAMGVSNDMTILGAQLFFFGRLAHAVIYLMAVPLVRPVAFAVAWAGILLIARQLFV